jgi:hypothetical protein
VPASRLSLRSVATAAVLTIAALALSASAASAGVLVSSASSCDDQAVAKTFLPWLDAADYTALSGGDFESGAAGWFTNGPAQVAGGNESFQIGGSSDAHSMALNANSSVTSPAICVGLEHPTLRFFAKRRTTGLLASLSTLRVDALVELADGTVVPLPIGVVTGLSSWQPTLPMAIVGNLLALLPGEHTAVAFRFTAQSGDWSIDDVWVDPYGRKP